MAKAANMIVLNVMLPNDQGKNEIWFKRISRNFFSKGQHFKATAVETFSLENEVVEFSTVLFEDM